MTFRPHVPFPKALPTVKIAAPGSESGYVVINESDFDASTHKKYEEQSALPDKFAYASRPLQSSAASAKAPRKQSADAVVAE